MAETPRMWRALSPCCMALLGVLASGSARSADAGPATSPACNLLSRAEVKAQIPWASNLDALPLREEPLTNGISCGFPSVVVHVLTLPAASWNTWITTFRMEPNEAVAGIGDEAWLRNNRNRHAEFVVRQGTQVVCVLYNYAGSNGEPFASAKLAVIALGKAYAAKLR
jgi:hypothetical protein